MHFCLLYVVLEVEAHSIYRFWTRLKTVYEIRFSDHAIPRFTPLKKPPPNALPGIRSGITKPPSPPRLYTLLHSDHTWNRNVSIRDSCLRSILQQENGLGQVLSFHNNKKESRHLYRSLLFSLQICDSN